MALSISGERARIPRRNDDGHGIGNRQRAQLIHGHGRAVIIDAHVVEQRDVRAAGAHAGQLPPEILNRFLHARFGLRHGVFAGGNRGHRRILGDKFPAGRPARR